MRRADAFIGATRRHALKVLRRALDTAKDRLWTPMQRRSQMRNICERIARLARNPNDAALYQDLAEAFAITGRWTTAAALYRSSQSLGNLDPALPVALAHAYRALGLNDMAAALAAEGRLSPTTDQSPLLEANHNRYHRCKSLADRLRRLSAGRPFSVCDVGGGDGFLSLLIPEARYVLVDPDTTGVSGLELPFPDGVFDVVVACHVLEHVSQPQRHRLLAEFCRTARHHVLLLNPFADPDARVEARLRLVLQITGASWAKEHLECTLPLLSEVFDFAALEGLRCQSEPTGSLLTSLAFVFLDHFAVLAGREGDLRQINRLFNGYFADRLTQPSLPNSYLVQLDLADQGPRP